MVGSKENKAHGQRLGQEGLSALGSPVVPEDKVVSCPFYALVAKYFLNYFLSTDISTIYHLPKQVEFRFLSFTHKSPD